MLKQCSCILLNFANSSFQQTKIRNVKYEDRDSPNLLLDVESLGGMRTVQVDEG